MTLTGRISPIGCGSGRLFERAVKLESPAQMLLINTIASTFPADFKFRKRPRCGLQVDCNWGEQKQ
jgi:hypothetical protein